MIIIEKDLEKIKKVLPGLDCGACGYPNCNDFAAILLGKPEYIKKCIHVAEAKAETQNVHGCIGCKGDGTGERLGWKDTLKRDFDFILDSFDDEPGPRETILPYVPQLIKDLNIKKGDIMIGRPMGMSCGCPITHCGIVTGVDARNGVIDWCVTGPLRPRAEGFVDIGYYTAQAYEGIIKEYNTDIKLGVRYWFLPRRCMLQWRHSGLVNSVTRLKDGSIKVRIEGLFIG